MRKSTAVLKGQRKLSVDWLPTLSNRKLPPWGWERTFHSWLVTASHIPKAPAFTFMAPWRHDLTERENVCAKATEETADMGLAMVFLSTLGLSRSSSGDHFKHRIAQERGKRAKSKITEEKSDLGSVWHLECSLALPIFPTKTKSDITWTRRTHRAPPL